MILEPEKSFLPVLDSDRGRIAKIVGILMRLDMIKFIFNLEIEENCKNLPIKYNIFDPYRLERRLKIIPNDEDYPKQHFMKLCQVLEERSSSDIVIIPELITTKIMSIAENIPMIEENHITDLFKRRLGVDGKFLPTQWKKKLFFLYESKSNIQQFFIIYRITPSEWMFHNFFYDTKCFMQIDLELKSHNIQCKSNLLKGLKIILKEITDWSVKLKPWHEFFPKTLNYHEDHLISIDSSLNIKQFSKRIIFYMIKIYATEYEFVFKNLNQKRLDISYQHIFPDSS